MKKAIIAGVLAAGAFFANTCWAQSQQTRNVPSLADLARRLRVERSGGSQKAAKVYTNDNLPRQGALSDVASENDSSQTGSNGANATTAKTDSGSSTGAAAKAGAHDEKYYHDALAELEATKAMHEKELAVLDQKLSLNETQYYADPNKTLNQEFSRSDINKKQGEIEEKKKQIAGDQKAIDDLRAQCQQEGCPAGWLR